MTTSTSRKSYQDCFDLLEQALNSKGLRVHFIDEGAAKHYRLRIHKARAIDRDQNAITYPKDHHEHGVSVYDPIVCRVKFANGKWWLYVEKRTLDEMVIESLGEEQPEYEPVEELQSTPEPDLPMIEAQPKPLHVERLVRRI